MSERAPVVVAVHDGEGVAVYVRRNGDELGQVLQTSAYNSLDGRLLASVVSDLDLLFGWSSGGLGGADRVLPSGVEPTAPPPQLAAAGVVAKHTGQPKLEAVALAYRSGGGIRGVQAVLGYGERHCYKLVRDAAAAGLLDPSELPRQGRPQKKHKERRLTPRQMQEYRQRLLASIVAAGGPVAYGDLAPEFTAAMAGSVLRRQLARLVDEGQLLRGTSLGRIYWVAPAHGPEQ